MAARSSHTSRSARNFVAPSPSPPLSTPGSLSSPGSSSTVPAGRASARASSPCTFPGASGNGVASDLRYGFRRWPTSACRVAFPSFPLSGRAQSAGMHGRVDGTTSRQIGVLAALTADGASGLLAGNAVDRVGPSGCHATHWGKLQPSADSQLRPQMDGGIRSSPQGGIHGRRYPAWPTPPSPFPRLPCTRLQPFPLIRGARRGPRGDRARLLLPPDRCHQAFRGGRAR